ncbi:hypothetical protein D3C75_1195940 [compost metagenome]
MRPGELENTIGHMAVAVLLQRRQAGGAVFTHAVEDIQRQRHVGFQPDPLTDGDDRIDHRPGAIGQGFILI